MSSDPLEEILEHEDAVEQLSSRNDRIGAAAGFLLALARDEEPDVDDLKTLDLRREHQ